MSLIPAKMLFINRIFCWMVLLASCMGLLAGCSYLYPRPEEDPQARKLLDQLDTRNAELGRFKALADVRMAAYSQEVSGRVAMAAVLPDKFRIEWLNMMGQPLTSLSGDGKMITIHSHIDSKRHRLRQTPKAMEPLIHIPIGVEDLQKILIGRIPVPADITVQGDAQADDLDCLLFKNRWRTVVETVTVNRLTTLPQDLKRFNQQGELLYQVRWLKWRTAGKYLIPVKLELESATRQRVRLKVDRFWPDAEIPDSIFRLQ